MAPRLQFEGLDTEDLIAASVGQRKAYSKGKYEEGATSTSNSDWVFDND